MLEFFSTLNSYLWGWPMLIMLLGTHLLMTVRLRVPQRWIFKGIRLSLRKDKDAQGEVSQFSALATALGATIGTGNIVGVATAVSLGGPGAVLWCWLTGVLGIATKYAEALLAVKYRVKDDKGRYLGGPMYALERGLGWKWLAVLFAVFTAIATLGIGGAVSSNAIATVISDSFGIPTTYSGAILAVLVAAVLLGGVKSVARVCAAIVPFMAVVYIGGCVVILVFNSDYLLPALRLIVVSAFTPEAVGGGLAGRGVMLACRYGIARGLFSNESGLGSAPIVAATARTQNPVRQALISATGTFWDTVVICAMTGLVIVSSILAYPDIDYSDGAMLTRLAFAKIPCIGTPLLAFGLLSFAFSTVIGWETYGERSVQYVSSRRYVYYYRFVYVLMVFVGSVVNLTLLWEMSDTFNALMAIPNLLSLIFLNKVIVAETRKYLWEKRLDERAEEE
ncbi:MAG: sodium:alanine symporter family protein [Bacteroidaceae bacterium]|nr:sodium:alanine symporter family protein [Bacteroidaceae bacterium]